MTNRIILYIEDANGNMITTNCPIAFRDVDETIDWTQGTHVVNGHWVFKIPVGLPSGIKWAVQTGAGEWTEDEYLNGGAFIGDEKGMIVSNPLNIR